MLRACIAETQEEYFEALSLGPCKAELVRIRGVITFWSSVMLQAARVTYQDIEEALDNLGG